MKQLPEPLRRHLAPARIFGGHKRLEFLAINPNGAVPAAVDGDLTLSEIQCDPAIRGRPEGFRQALSKDLKRRADINRWLLWEGSAWFPSCYTYLVEYVVKPLLNDKPDDTIIDKAAPNWHRLADILDGGWRCQYGLRATM
jgi:glutathione S-transferase